jgi:glycerol uptake facilitator-like aquaporin
MSVLRSAIAETLGSLLLLATVVGSGIMGVQLSQGNDAIALLANAGATAGMLYVLINVLGPISGAHFNPVVSISMFLRKELSATLLLAYVISQCIGAIAGVVLAHAMFDQALLQSGDHIRSGWPQWISEAVAACGLLMTILLGSRHRAQAMPALVASYIFAAYWFTASTSFANPAVTLARSFTTSFAGIAPQDVIGFVLAQFAGMLLALLLSKLLLDQSAVVK